MSASLEKTDFHGIPGYTGGPKERPAVIVLQEWWGVTDEIKDQAQYLSKAGNFRVLIPDLYKVGDADSNQTSCSLSGF